jgi:hypothetical protein
VRGSGCNKGAGLSVSNWSHFSLTPLGRWLGSTPLDRTSGSSRRPLRQWLSGPVGDAPFHGGGAAFGGRAGVYLRLLQAAEFAVEEEERISVGPGERGFGLIGALRAFAASGLRCGREVDGRALDHVREAGSVLALDRGKRRVDDLTTEWTAASHIPTTARNRIPLHNCNSSGWIRTTDLTIMSRAL